MQVIYPGYFLKVQDGRRTKKSLFNFSYLFELTKRNYISLRNLNRSGDINSPYNDEKWW